MWHKCESEREKERDSIEQSYVGTGYTIYYGYRDEVRRMEGVNTI